jgi:hypothetical protein
MHLVQEYSRARVDQAELCYQDIGNIALKHSYLTLELQVTAVMDWSVCMVPTCMKDSGQHEMEHSDEWSCHKTHWGLN